MTFPRMRAAGCLQTAGRGRRSNRRRTRLGLRRALAGPRDKGIRPDLSVLAIIRRTFAALTEPPPALHDEGALSDGACVPAARSKRPIRARRSAGGRSEGQEAIGGAALTPKVPGPSRTGRSQNGGAGLSAVARGHFH